MTKYYYIIIALLLLACDGNEKQQTKYSLASQSIVWNLVDNESNPFGKLKTEYIVLSGETKNSYLADLVEVVVSDNKYYVRDANRINVYDEKGLYLQTISNQGRAKNEYLKLADMSILADTLYILDGESDAIIRYNKSGQFISKDNLDVTLYSDLATTSKGFIFYRPVYDEPNDGNIDKYALTEKDWNLKTIGSHLKYGPDTPMLGLPLSIVDSDSLSFFTKCMIDEVVVINRNSGVKSTITIDFKDEKMPENKDESLEIMFSEHGNCYYLTSTPILYKNWLIGSCMKNSVVSSFAINIDTQEAFLDNGILNQLPTSTFTYGDYLYRILDQSSQNESFIANSPDFVRSALSEGKSVLLKMWINE